jgi:8-oxo-dGTP pyrophosphatase MutT (NUDIX family)
MSTDATIECTSFDGSKIWLPKSRLSLRPSAYAVIQHKGRVLLVTNRRSGKYYFPGGGIEQGEQVKAGLRREVKEETGIEIEDERLVHFAEEFFYYNPLDEAYHALLFYYACKPKTLDVSSKHQVDDGEGYPQWVSSESLKAQDFHNHGELLLGVLQSVSMP